jgi:hydroxymethylglutaryl-CoA lyase
MKIIECPRDAMQGIHSFIPTEKKIDYINALLQVGFDTIDFGSFVSPKAMPQMADSWKVISRLKLDETDTKLLAIVANERGAKEALSYPEIDYLGFPFSISETFQLRNTNASQQEAFDRVKDIQNLCLQKEKTLVVYLSMGFGNPYGDFWAPELVEHWTDRFAHIGVEIISLSDTIGVATPNSIANLFDTVIQSFPTIEFGAHLHTEPHNWREKVAAAFDNGCERFDGAIRGFGGCPMAQNKLVGNMPTENLVRFFLKERKDFYIGETALIEAIQLSMSVFEGNDVITSKQPNLF